MKREELNKLNDDQLEKAAGGHADMALATCPKCQRQYYIGRHAAEYGLRIPPCPYCTLSSLRVERENP